MTTLAEVQADIGRQLTNSFSYLSDSEKKEMCRCGLTGEVGETMEIFKGRVRKYPKDLARCTDDDLKSELGDVLWYLTALCELYGTSLDEIYQLNCDKLDRRHWR